jgi:hypothetical protein
VRIVLQAADYFGYNRLQHGRVWRYPVPIPRKQAGAFRLAVWNASMAVHAKLSRLAEIEPDIAVVPECASIEIVRRKLAGDAPPHSMAWIGMKPNKGLGVFGFGGTSVMLATTTASSHARGCPRCRPSRWDRTPIGSAPASATMSPWSSISVYPC